MKSPASSTRSTWLAKILALAAADYVTGSLSLFLANPPGSTPTVWPPAGIALAGVLLFGYRVWPGIWLGTFLTYFATFFDGSSSQAVLRSLTVAAGNGLGDALQAIAAGWLVLRLLGKVPTLASLKEVLVVTALAGLVGSTVSSTVGTAAGVAVSAVGHFWTTWWAAWRANGVGVLVFAPLILTIPHARPRTFTSLRFRRVAEAAVILLAFLIHAFFLTDKLGTLLSASLGALFLLWATLRFSTVGTALGIMLMALVLIWNVKKGEPLLGAINARLEWRVVTAQTILAFLGLTFWALAAIEQERERVVRELRFLSDASATLAALVDYESTLQKVASLAVPYMADWCAVDLAEANGQLRRLAVAHVDPTKVRLAYELDERYPPNPEAPHGAYHVLRTGAPEMLSDVSDAILTELARDKEHFRILRELGFGAYMCVPLRARQKAVGVVTFVTAESGRKYDAADLAFAEELSRRAAIAIENVQLYADLRNADRLKDEFLAMLAHELRNPLAPIRNALHIMKQPAANAVVGQVREMAERQVQHMARLLDDLLDVSRVSRGKIDLRKVIVDLAAVLHRAVEGVRPLLDERGHQFTISLPPELPRIEGDPTRLEQVVTNLLNNAAKYTDPGGQISLLAGREDDEVVLRVRDTGIGIAPDMLPRIFDLFVQAERGLDRAPGGVGIGLTLVRKLVELHGGSVAAHSAGLGRGSEFVVRLPALAAELPFRQTETDGGSLPASDLATHRVLVVDDNVDAADSLAMLLRLAGQEVRVAYDGSTALKVAQDFHPQVVLLDLGMPGMDGYEVARQLRENPHVKPELLVAMTGWGQEEDRRRSLAAGFDQHLVKPAEPQQLEQLLHGKT